MINFNSKSNKTNLNIVRITFLATVLYCNTADVVSQDIISSPKAGFDIYNKNVLHGTTRVVSYYSSTVGISRNTRIYFPPGYTKDSTYNVLYLLHGIGGDVNEWLSNGAPTNILDNLYALGKIAPMIVVLPNGRAMVDDSPGSNIYAADKVAGFANFEKELINDLVPFIDSAYPVYRNREARAIAGLSMGGGQSLNFGLAHLDTFAWVGAFSPAPNTKAANLLIPNLADASKILGLWISCGDADGLFSTSKNIHDFLVQKQIKHFYLVEPGKGHDWSVWKPGLYHFTQRIFGRVPDTTSNTKISPCIVNPEFNISYNRLNQTITLPESSTIKKLSIYDVNGRLQFLDSNMKTNILSVNQLKDGMYLVVLFDGKRNLFGKLVK